MAASKISETIAQKRRDAGHIHPFKQIRPGDELEPVKEWTNQFEGTSRFAAEIVDFFIDNKDEFLVEHTLGRPIVGAVLLGVLGDFAVQNGFTYVVLIEESTNFTFPVNCQRSITGTLRWLVF